MVSFLKKVFLLSLPRKWLLWWSCSAYRHWLSEFYTGFKPWQELLAKSCTLRTQSDRRTLHDHAVCFPYLYFVSLFLCRTFISEGMTDVDTKPILIWQAIKTGLPNLFFVIMLSTGPLVCLACNTKFPSGWKHLKSHQLHKECPGENIHGTKQAGDQLLR